MTAKYLLPCPCGQQIVIEPRQAGETVPCSCGASLLIPTWLAMTDLEPATSEPAPALSQSTWGLKHRLRLLGAVFVLIGLVGGIWLYLEWRTLAQRRLVDPEQLRQTAQKLLPSQTWDIWQTMKQGLDRRTDQQYAAAVSEFHVKQGFVAALALLGIFLIVAGTIGVKDQGSATRGGRFTAH